MKTGKIRKEMKNRNGFIYWTVKYLDDVLQRIQYFKTELEADNFISSLKSGNKNA